MSTKSKSSKARKASKNKKSTAARRSYVENQCTVMGTTKEWMEGFREENPELESHFAFLNVGPEEWHVDFLGIPRDDDDYSAVIKFVTSGVTKLSVLCAAAAFEPSADDVLIVHYNMLLEDGTDREGRATIPRNYLELRRKSEPKRVTSYRLL